MTMEFQKAAEAYAKAGDMCLLPLTVCLKGVGCERRTGTESMMPWMRFRPEFVLVEPYRTSLESIQITDIKFGNQSMLRNHEPVPASLYSIDEALALFDQNPESPAWDRFRIGDGNRALEPEATISVTLEEHETAFHNDPRVVRFFFFGRTGTFSPLETKVFGTLRTIGMTSDGPFVEVAKAQKFMDQVRGVHTEELVRFPVAAKELQYLTKRIGQDVKFILSVEE